MRFAIISDERTTPSPGLTGTCPACGREMIAKCGPQRVHHWAHRGERVCDSWWEPETLWHRTWKSKFPVQWQEVIRLDQTGEKHIADVRTDHGLTIEFQHSHISPRERVAREKFYGNMMWVVDGSRLRRDLTRFIEGIRTFGKIRKGLFVTSFPEEVFPRNWVNCDAPVLFDFENASGLTEKTAHLSGQLWCLLPGRVLERAVVLGITKNDFVCSTLSGVLPIQTKKILELVRADLFAAQQREAQRTMRPNGFEWWLHRQNSRRRLPRF